MDIQINRYCRIRPGQVVLDGEVYLESTQQSCETQAFLSDIYRRLGIDYRKFFKMDILPKLGFLAAELLMKEADKEASKGDAGIVLFNRSSSLEADTAYQHTIQKDTDYFPSPAVFVYTLPNIVIGEIAIRNKIYGETAFYVFSQFESRLMAEIIEDTMHQSGMKYLIAGWTEATSDSIDCLMMHCEAGITGNNPLCPEKIEKLFYNINN